MSTTGIDNVGIEHDTAVEGAAFAKKNRIATGKDLGKSRRADVSTSSVMEGLRRTHAPQGPNDPIYRRLVEGVRENYFFFTNDHADVVTYVSPSVHALLGFLPSDIIGRNWSDFVDVSNPVNQQIIESDRRPLHGDRPLTQSRVLVDAAGRNRIFEIHTFGVLDESGGAVENGGIAKDVTEERNQYADLAARLRSHERRIADTVKQATPEDLVSAIVHELRQPLTAITSFGYAACHQLKACDAVPETVMKSIGSIIDAAHLAAGILGRLVNPAGQQGGETTAEGIHSMVEDTVRLFAQEVGRNLVDIRFQRPSTGTTVNVDQVQIREVLINLIRNAIEAVGEAGTSNGIIDIQTYPREGFLEFVVADNGPGISEDKKNNLFRASASDKPFGMGIGLSVCKKLVEWHGGHIWHTKHEPSGAEFHFTLPLTESGRA